MKIAVVYGTRPEAIKLAPVVIELRKRGVEPEIVATGQHTSLLAGTPAESVLVPNINLQLCSANDPLVYARDCGRKLTAAFRQERPDLIVVQGDTASAYAGACVGKWLEIPVAHVEAGIRTGDPWDPWPEENFRVGIDRISEAHFYATGANFDNVRCGMPDTFAHVTGKLVTGNTGIDALYSHTRPLEHPNRVQDRVLVTLHRRESFGDPLKAIVSGIVKGAEKYAKLEFMWPAHPNPKVQEALPTKRPQNLWMIQPMATTSFAAALAASRAVITDSGGVQEEAAALGIPCVVAREKTDRPESVEINLAKVVGRTESGILQGLEWALGFGARCVPSDCFGDGNAAPRVVEHLLNGASNGA